jgi:hypothetical protein
LVFNNPSSEKVKNGSDKSKWLKRNGKTRSCVMGRTSEQCITEPRKRCVGCSEHNNNNKKEEN